MQMIHRRLIATRLMAAATAIAYFHSAGAFSGALIRQGVFLCNRSPLQLKSNNHDRVEEDENIKEQIVDPIRRRRKKNLDYWGVEHLASPGFPSTFGEVADEVFRAISGTICGLQRPDPNVASNAMHQSVLDYRPTQPHWASRRRWANGDDGDDFTVKQLIKKGEDAPARMGIEIDGAAYLSDQSNDEGRAMRIISLQIAQRLCSYPWDGGEKSVRPRSVAVYFNSLKQSLLASRELSDWKSKIKKSFDHDYLDHIKILCIGQDSLPSNMVKEKKKRNQQTRKTQSTDTIPENIILIVKPTDYDTDSLIPVHGDPHSSAAIDHRPTIQANVVDKLQTLLFQASASSVPAVVLSPRLSELPPLQAMSETYKRTGPSGFEQSGFQKSATYGGIEPPVGPTSWLLRDFVPPIYVWAGCANFIKQRKHSRQSIAASFRQQQCDMPMEEDGSDVNGPSDEQTYSYYSRVALTQSAMETGHSWHMFAVQEKLKPPHLYSSSSAKQSHAHRGGQLERDVSYHYIGSTNASRGRPSRRIMNDVFEEFCEAS